MLHDEFLWVERYRPRSIEETILPKELKATFQKFVDDNQVPNLLLTGTAGVGKTTVARAMLDQMGCDYIVINGSKERGIDVIRDLDLYASSVSIMGGRKYVIIDEADYLTMEAQTSFRNFMETYSRNCGFILTCNYPKKIIPAISESRCTPISFKVAKADLPDLAKQFMKRSCNILKENNIEFDKQAVAEVIKKYLPDWRRVLNELQRYSACGKIDSGILVDINQVSLKDLVGFLKEKNFTNVRKWVGENIHNDVTSVYREIYDTASSFMEKKSIPLLVVILAKYQYQNAFVADPEINLVACLTEIMMDCSFNV